MNKQMLNLYRQYRARGVGGIVGQEAKTCLEYARTEILWAELEDAGLVKLELEPDECPDLSYLDQTDAQMGRGWERTAALERDRANNEGCWIVVTSYRLSLEHAWIVSDSVGGFIGDDWKGSGYDMDCKRLTIDTYLDDLANVCPACNGTGKKHNGHTGRA